MSIPQRKLSTPAQFISTPTSPPPSYQHHKKNNSSNGVSGGGSVSSLINQIDKTNTNSNNNQPVIPQRKFSAGVSTMISKYNYNDSGNSNDSVPSNSSPPIVSKSSSFNSSSNKTSTLLSTISPPSSTSSSTGITPTILSPLPSPRRNLPSRPLSPTPIEPSIQPPQRNFPSRPLSPTPTEITSPIPLQQRNLLSRPLSPTPIEITPTTTNNVTLLTTPSTTSNKPPPPPRNDLNNSGNSTTTSNSFKVGLAQQQSKTLPTPPTVNVKPAPPPRPWSAGITSTTLTTPPPPQIKSQTTPINNNNNLNTPPTTPPTNQIVVTISTSSPVTSPTLLSSLPLATTPSIVSNTLNKPLLTSTKPPRPKLVPRTNLTTSKEYDDTPTTTIITPTINNEPESSPSLVSSSLSPNGGDLRTSRQRTLTRKQASMKLVTETTTINESSTTPTSSPVQLSPSILSPPLTPPLLQTPIPLSNEFMNEVNNNSLDLNSNYSDESTTSAQSINSSVSSIGSNNSTNTTPISTSPTTSSPITSSPTAPTISNTKDGLSVSNFITTHKKKGSFLQGTLRRDAGATISSIGGRKDTMDLKSILIEKIQEQYTTVTGMSSNCSRKLKLPPINQSSTINKVVNEIIETEADYLDDMEVIINLYLFASIEMSKYKIMTDEHIRNIFSNVEELYHISLKLYPMLLKTIPLLESNEYPNIEEIFLYNSKSFQRYGSYLSLHDNSIKTLNSLIESNQIIAGIFQYIKSLSHSRQLDLQSFLIKPCQRLCKYPLLLRELKRAVPEDDEVHQRIFGRSVKLMEKIVLDINGKISNDEKIQSIIKEIGTKEIEQLLMRDQKYLKDYKMKKQKKQGKVVVLVNVYLMDQLLIIFEKGKFLKKVQIIHLKNIVEVIDIEREFQYGIGIVYTKDGVNNNNSTSSINVSNSSESIQSMSSSTSSMSSSTTTSSNNSNILKISLPSYQDKLVCLYDFEEAIDTLKILTDRYIFTVSSDQAND